MLTRMPSPTAWGRSYSAVRYVELLKSRTAITSPHPNVLISAIRTIINSQFLANHYLPQRNVERFSLGGAAHRRSREGPTAGSAPVSEKRIGLSRSPVARAMGVECTQIHRQCAVETPQAAIGSGSPRQACDERGCEAAIWRFGSCAGTPTVIAAQAFPPRSDGRFGFVWLDRRSRS
jgi:hypothetical protein